MDLLREAFEPRPGEGLAAPKQREDTKPELPEKNFVPDPKIGHIQTSRGSSSPEQDGAEIAIMGLTNIHHLTKRPRQQLSLGDASSSLPLRRPKQPAGDDVEPFVIDSTLPSNHLQPGQPPAVPEHLEESRDVELHREINQLRLKLDATKIRADLAEGRIGKLEQRNADLKRRLDGAIDSNQILRQAALVHEKNEKLEDLNTHLTDQLRDAHSHIFSLQPYRKELTPEEVGRVSTLN